MAMKICIDPGHGGKDPGAVGPTGIKEKDVALAVALKVAEKLKKAGVNVCMTRNNDTFLELKDRCKIANNFGADYFVSIHCNSATNSSANGTETYCYQLGGKGEALAKAIQEELISTCGRNNRGVKTANYYVIKYTSMPAALTELAFISNPTEEKLLASSDFQEKCAAAIANAIARQLGISISGEMKEVEQVKVSFGGLILDGFLKDGKTYVEVRKLCEALGLKVVWDAKSKTVEVRK